MTVPYTTMVHLLTDLDSLQHANVDQKSSTLHLDVVLDDVSSSQNNRNQSASL
jgi:hypothetical protein